MAESRRLSEEMKESGKILSFSSPFTSGDYFLLEVDKNLADNIENGQSQVFLVVTACI